MALSFNRITSLAVCVLVVGIVVQFIAHHHSTSPKQLQYVADWRQLVSNRVPSRGRAGASIVLIEFTDYQCPFCRALEPRLQKLISQHEDELAFYRYDLPLENIHPGSTSAANAARCVEQDPKAELFRSGLYEQDVYTADALVDLARRVGITRPGAVKCIVAEGARLLVKADLTSAKNYGVGQTPTLLVNGVVSQGAVTQAYLETMLNEAVGKISR